MDTTEEKQTAKTEKFLFDLNDFAEGHLDRMDGNEPAPVFNEEELEAAKKEAYDQGKQAGISESQASRERSVAELIRIISRDTSILFEAEAGREKTYELESINLSLAIFKKLLPHYTKDHGLNELKESITSILKKKIGQSTIIFDVHPDTVSGVEEHIKTIQTADNAADTNFTVRGNETLGEGDCKLSWADGGALRNSQAISEEIEALMFEALAAHGVNVHDNENESELLDINPEDAVEPINTDTDDDKSGDTT